MDTYYVAYTILDENTGAAVGNGSCTMDMDPPRDFGEVQQLADHLTEDQRRNGPVNRQGLPAHQYVHVTAWSRLGA